jgi:hypothetical protein
MTIYCKTHCNLLNNIAEKTKVDTKLMKLVLNWAKFELHAALGNTKARVDTKLTELVLYCANSKLNQTLALK